MKPPLIAMQFNGDNHAPCSTFCGGALQVDSIDDDGGAYVLANPRLHTSRGVLMVNRGDWIVRRGGVNPCFWLLPEEFKE